MSNKIIVDPEQLEEELDDGNLEEEYEELENSDDVEELEEEIERGGKSPDSDIPEKFKGKDVKDIVEAYKNLERAYSRQGQELGEIRKHADSLIKQTLEFREEKGKSREDEKEITAEDIWTNPTEAIDRIVERRLKDSSVSKELEQIKSQSAKQQIRSNYERFVSKHPDATDITNSEEFLEWANSTPVRADLLKRAQNYDFAAGDELVSVYKELKGLNKKKESKERQEARRKKTLKDAAVESNSTGETSKKIFKRRNILRMIRENPEEYYSDDFQQELQKAYLEGRVR